METKKSDISEADLEVLSIDPPEESLPPTPTENPGLPKKRRKGPVILITILAILIIIGAGLAVYMLFFQPKPTTTTDDTTNKATQNNKPSDDAKDYAADLIAKIRTAEEALAVTFPKLKVEASNDNSPALKYGANKYYIAGDFGKGLVVTDSSNTDPQGSFSVATQTAATEILDAEPGLAKTSSDYSHTYKSNDVLCTVGLETHPTYIACANIIDYKATAEAVAPFASALFATNGTKYEDTTVIREPTITKKSDSYASAVASIGNYEGVGGYAGLFYSTDGAKNWVYWKGTQSVLLCEDYNTYALQKSFEGDTCYTQSSDAETTVKVTLTN